MTLFQTDCEGLNMREKTLSAIFLVAFLLFAFSGKASAQGKIVQNELKSEGKERSYYLFVPESVKKNSPAPLLVLLHGSGRDGKILIEHWKKLAEQEGIILVGPNATRSTGWAVPEDGPLFLFDVVEKLKSEHSIDSKRVYLFGHSAGAVFSLFMSMFESNYFAATAVSAGAIKKENYSLLDEAERKTPIALFVGTKDPFFPLAEVRRTRDIFIEKKFTIELTEIPNLDHNYYSKSSEINEKAWNFLKKYQLENEQKYKQYQFK